MINRDKEEIKSAIEILQHSNQLLLNHIELIKNQKYLTNGGKYYRKIENCEAEYNAVNLAIKALKKQIPEKPVPFKRTAHDFSNGTCSKSGFKCEYIEQFNHEYEYTEYSCPFCGKKASDGTPNFCCLCGKALDWSDENE